MNAEETIQSLFTSLEALEKMVQTQADRIRQLQRERDALVTNLDAMMARCMTSEASAINLVED